MTQPQTAPAAKRPLSFYAICVGIGLLAGLLSGLFGVGGGTVIVPMLVLLLRFDQRLAAGTSLAAIVPTAIVGVISYAAHGSVNWLAALLLAIGAVGGAQIGSWLLSRLPVNALKWAFIVFLLFVVVMLFVVVPSRDTVLTITWPMGVALLGLGIITGILSGLLGVGGGIVVVPALMFLFGFSDLIAKGTSLLMMIPTAISGTLGNVKRKNVDLPVAICVGAAACTTTALGALIATALQPEAANILFAVFLIFIAGQMAVRTIRAQRAARGA